MKIFLIYPLLSRKRARVDENKQFWPPLGLAYLASVLEKAGHSVKVLDRDVVLRREGLDFEKTDRLMLKEIADFRPDYIGISATTPNMYDVGLISEKIKKMAPDVSVILGGPHGSAIPQETLDEFPGLDIVVMGEGERTMIDIVSGVPIPGVKGIAYRRNGKAVVNDTRPPIENIDGLPMPGRHLLEMDFYLRPSRFTSRNLSLRTTSIFTARGCPYRCDFCAGPVIFPGKVRYHSVERVLLEIDELVGRYKVEALYFAEDMFLSHKKRAIELLEGFLKRPWAGRLKWFAQARVNVIDREMCGLMKSSGCVGVEYGFESGSQRMLDIMNKGVKVEENLNAALVTRKAGLRFQANIIVGYPGETKEDFEATIAFLRMTKPDNIGFNLFMPLPGTAAYKRLKASGAAIPPWDEIGDPEIASVSYAAMSKEDFERLYLAARFEVILPMNLRNFIMGNMKNPLRLVFLLATQFWGTAVKSVKALFRLRRLERVYGKR